MKIKWQFLVLLLLVSVRGIAQIYPFSYFTAKNGLPSSIVNQSFQDSKGNIWFATQGGLDMFNGIKHRKFTKESGLLSINITCVTEDKNGTIWIGTDQGGAKYEHGKFTTVVFSKDLKEKMINHILCDSKNRIWFSTNGSGICVLENDKYTYLNSTTGLTSDIIFSTYETRDGNIWVGTRKGGICVFDINKKMIKKYSTDNGFESRSAFTIFEDSKNNIWIGTNGRGIFKLTNGKFSRIKSDILGSEQIFSIDEDEQNTLWFATDTKGILKISKNDTVFINVENGLKDVFALHLFIDESNNIWVSTNGSGVCVLKNLYMKHYELSSNAVGAIEKFDDKTLALSNGLELIDNNHKVKNLIKDLNGSSILVDKYKDIWIATSGNGIKQYKIDKNLKLTNVNTFNDSTLSITQVTKLVEIEKDKIWAVTYGKGIIELDRKGILKNINANLNQIPSNDLLCAYKSSSGQIWIGTYKAGAILYQNNSFKVFGSKQGLNSLNINTITGDHHNKIYLGSADDGIYCYTNGSFIHFTKKDGLISDQITALACDNQNNLWVGTPSGISYIVFDRNSNIEGVKNYSESQGFNALEVSSNGIISTDKQVWISSVDGLYSIELDKLPKTILPAHIIVDELKINTESQNWDEKNFIINNKLNLPENLELTYKENRLTFELRSFSYLDLAELKFSYFLDGFDEKWSPYTSNRILDFPNLHHGKYTLHIKAKNGSGIESEEIVYSFKITPPFYKTWWFITLCILSGAALIYGYIKNRTQKLVAEKRILEERVAQRTEYIETQKHEIEKQKEIIEEKNKEVIDSITYARRIQRAMLTSEFYVKKYLKEHFILFKPKDIVSGDFYWIYADPENEGIVYVVTADCTGHGVPGGFMSMMGINLLKEIIDGRRILNTDAIINLLRKEIIKNLNPEGATEEAKDGMDMVICKYDFNKMTLEYTAANNALYLLRNGELIEYKGDKMPVGKYGDSELKSFTSNIIDLQKNDIIYCTTDGFPDQFGGQKGKKLMYKKFEAALVGNSHLPMEEQLSKLTKIFVDWVYFINEDGTISEYEQVDDVTVIGVRI